MTDIRDEVAAALADSHGYPSGSFIWSPESLLAALAARGLTVVREAPTGTKLVLMTDELFAALGADRVEWGEPDEAGRYTPTVFRSHD